MNSPVSDDKFKNWEPLDFEYSDAMKRLDKIRDFERFDKRRDLDELDVEEELGLSNYS